MKKKLFAFFMTLLLSASLIPTVFAASDKYGLVKDISKSDSVKSGNGSSLDVVISNNETANVTIDYGKNSGITLQYLSSNSQGRPDNAAWLGFHIDTPSSSEARNAKFSVNGSDEEAIDPDGDYYFGITEEKLKTATEKGEAITYKYVFKWSEENTQTVTVNIYPKFITLKNKAGDSNLWTPSEYTKYTPKDEAPTTGETIPTLFIAIISMTLGLGAYNLVLASSKK